jgi:hypothetical protein
MKGIIFKQDLHRAVIEGRKTQTRRTGGLDLVNENPDKNNLQEWTNNPEVCKKDKHGSPKEGPGETKVSLGWHAIIFNLKTYQ